MWVVFLPLLFAATCYAIGQPSVVSFSGNSSTAFLLAASSNNPVFIVSPDDYPGIHMAASTFLNDIMMVSSQNLSVINSTSPSFQGSSAVIVGSIEKSSLIKYLVKSSKISVSEIDRQWESFKIITVENPWDGLNRALVIIGADKRGTIYGLYDLSEQIGVSPWWWWADVAVKKNPEIYVEASGGGYIAASPSVKYRGLFLNDEQPSLTNWAIKHYGTNTTVTFKSDFYGDVFELILRLKGNLIWGAMWSAMFCVDDDGRNQWLADRMGIVYSTSHQEPMARNTPEWTNYGNGIWNYTTNAPFLSNFWTYGVERAKNYETFYTVGMRGDGDLPLPGANIQIIETIIQNQQTIIQNVTTKANDTMPQLWCLYKEVLDLWNEGLVAPENILLLWTDDNWGNVRRLPTSSDRQRSGGSGMYYHFDYVGDPRDYKWHNSNSFAKIWEQMHLSYMNGVDGLWVVNVGDLKPLEAPISFWFDYAYNTTRWGRDNLREYVELWAAREFGQEVAGPTADVFSTFMRYVSRQKPELNTPTTYSLVNYREADTVLMQWETLAESAQDIYDSLSSTSQAAFFQLVLHPILAIGNVVILNIVAGKNNLYSTQSRMSANTLASDTLGFFAKDAALTRQYHSLSNGKWAHFMDQTHLNYQYWQGPMSNTLPPLSYMQSMETSTAGPMRIAVEGSSGAFPGDNQNNCAQGYSCPNPLLPILTPFGPKSRWFDVSQGSVGNWSWVASTNETYMQLSQYSGMVLASNITTWDTRVKVSVSDWSTVPFEPTYVQIQLNSTSSDPSFEPEGLAVSFSFSIVVMNQVVPSNFTGYVEADGGVSMDASNWTSNSAANGSEWVTIEGYSPYSDSGVGVTLFPVNMTGNFSAGQGPKLEYDFYVFSNISKVQVDLWLGAQLNYDPNSVLSYAIAIDNESAQTVAPIPSTATQSAYPSDWGAVVAANSRISSTNHTLSDSEAHKLFIWGINPGLVLEKVVIETGTIYPSYLGLPTSTKV